MRNTVLVVAAALALAMGTVPTIAADKGTQNGTQMNKNDSAAVEKNCADILANRSSHTDAEIKDCQAKQ